VAEESCVCKSVNRVKYEWRWESRERADTDGDDDDGDDDHHHRDDDDEKNEESPPKESYKDCDSIHAFSFGQVSKIGRPRAKKVVPVPVSSRCRSNWRRANTDAAVK
jgi:hypothetical protein